MQLLSTALLLSLLCAPSSANQLIEMAESKKLARADLVIIAIVTSTGHSNYPTLPANKSATVKIETVLKGSENSETVTVNYAFAYPDMSYAGLVVGKKFLFYLSMNSDGSYASVNGRFGVYELTNPPHRPPPVAP